MNRFASIFERETFDSLIAAPTDGPREDPGRSSLSGAFGGSMVVAKIRGAQPFRAALRCAAPLVPAVPPGLYPQHNGQVDRAGTASHRRDVHGQCADAAFDTTSYPSDVKSENLISACFRAQRPAVFNSGQYANRLASMLSAHLWRRGVER